jgi:NDP-sugar pyrophosphorylase family protein
MIGITVIDSILILSAGRGARLGKLTEDTPKPLLVIETPGVTVIDRLFNQCRRNFQDTPIHLNISYLAQSFLDHFSKRPIQDRPSFIFEYEALGPSKSLVEFLKFGYHKTLVINGDLVLSDSEFKNFAAKASASEHQIIVCHSRNQMSARSSVHSKNGRIVFVEEFESLQYKGPGNPKVSVCSGIYLFKSNSLNNFIPKLLDSLSPDLLNFSINAEETLQYNWNDWRFSIDSPETYKQCRKFLEPSN